MKNGGKRDGRKKRKRRGKGKNRTTLYDLTI